ncbi:putative receptor-type adenylate cyclase, partial [Trypanosoma theileri]
VRVFVLFSEVSLRYADFTAAFSGSVRANRLVFATNLPHWADGKTESETVQEFHAAVTDKKMRTPLSLRAFAGTQLVQTVLSRMDIVNADTLSNFFYRNIAVLLGPLAVQDMLLSVWREAVDAGVPFVSGQVITTGTNPLAKDTQYVAIQRFQREMEKYLNESGQTFFDDPQHFLNNDNDGEVMFSWWIAGEVLMQAMSSREWLQNRSTFVASLFDQRRYMIDDLVIG